MVLEIKTGLTRVGRFGWKAQVPTLHQFSGDAYLNEMGVTNPEFPDESCPQGDCAALAYNPFPALNNEGDAVDAFTDFMTLLGPPPQRAHHAGVGRGERDLCRGWLRRLSHPDAAHGRQPGEGAIAQDIRAILGFPVARHGEPG